MDDLLNSTGRCRACGGIVQNSSSKKGCSRAKLEAIHFDTCPGLWRSKRSTKKGNDEQG